MINENIELCTVETQEIQETTQEIIVQGRTIGKLIKTSTLGNMKFMAVMSPFPESDSRIFQNSYGHGKTPEEAIKNAIQSGIREAETFLTRIRAIQKDVFPDLA